MGKPSINFSFYLSPNSTDPRFKYYPVWRGHIPDEDKKDNFAVRTFSHNDIKQMIIMAMKHEFWVDIVRGRRQNFQYDKWKKWYAGILEEVKGNIKSWDIPEIYWDSANNNKEERKYGKN